MTTLLLQNFMQRLGLHSHEAPEGGKWANRIPAPAGPFFLAGRFYGPKASLIEGSYKIPECKRMPWQKQGGERTPS